MKTVKKEQMGNYATVQAGWNRPRTECMRELRDLAMKLEVKEGVFVSRDEWENKSDPTVKEKGKEFSKRTLSDRSGWIIMRVR